MTRERRDIFGRMSLGEVELFARTYGAGALPHRLRRTARRAAKRLVKGEWGRGDQHRPMDREGYCFE